jgi:hypothetical protein
MSFERNAPYAPTPDNRPAPLEHSPLAFTRESHSQMSFGERAALEGILAQLRPRLAIEIGTAEGGSLSRIADYSAEVHSIDLTHDELSVELPDPPHARRDTSIVRPGFTPKRQWDRGEPTGKLNAEHEHER